MQVISKLFCSIIIIPVKLKNKIGLKDLDQGQPYVRGKIIEYMNHLISLGVAGFRIDAAKHMWPEDLSNILANVNDLSTEFFPSGSRALIYQEVVDTGKSSSLFAFVVLTMSLL